jgi:hypothetical protein
LCHATNGSNRNAPPGATGTGTLFGPPLARVGKLIRLASSPEDHEPLGATRALDRLLRDHRADFHHLADIVESNWRDPIVIKPQRKRRPHQELAAELLSHPEILGVRPNGRLDPALLERERDFLEFMRRSATATEKQWRWLDDINVRRKAAA